MHRDGGGDVLQGELSEPKKMDAFLRSPVCGRVPAGHKMSGPRDEHRRRGGRIARSRSVPQMPCPHRRTRALGHSDFSTRRAGLARCCAAPTPAPSPAVAAAGRAEPDRIRGAAAAGAATSSAAGAAAVGAPAAAGGVGTADSARFHGVARSRSRGFSSSRRAPWPCSTAGRCPQLAFRHSPAPEGG